MRGWADDYVAKLLDGQTVQFRPRGHSMTGKINNGQLVTVVPIVPLLSEIDVGVIVLCKVNHSQYLHLVKNIDTKTTTLRYLIGNNKGGINGWITARGIYGRVTKVED